MPYVHVQDFRLGMDRKKSSRAVGLLGSAWTIKNGHLSRGGDIERRKKFVQQVGQFPSTTEGLYAVGDTLYTLGYDATQIGNVPAGVNHILTQHPTPATAITSIRHATAFDGSLYSIVEFSDGNIYHYYDANRVLDWDTIATTIGSNTAIASALAAAITNSTAVDATSASEVITITAEDAGTPFTIAQSTVNNGVSPQTEVLATADVQVTGGTSSPGVNRITSITVNAVEILGAAVDWATSHDATAAALKTQIDTYTSSPEYDITVSTDTITISAQAGTGTGADANGFVVAVTTGGDVTVTADASLSGGVDQVDSETITLVETQANVTEVTEVLATATVEITGGTLNAGINTMGSITIDGVNIMSAAVDWDVSNSDTASTIASNITAHTSSPNYTATADGPVITITAIAGTGAGPNGFVLVTNETGDVTSTHDATMSGGVTAVTPIAQVYTATIGGTFETADQFTITINGTEVYTVTGAASGTGTSILTFKNKLYSTAAANLYFSALNAPTQWISGVDYGFINMGSQTAGQEDLVVAEEYQGLVAVFSGDSIRIWSISEDSGANVFIETLKNTGTVATESVTPYGNNDVFYLDRSGIRSIKARDSSNAAYVDDVGTNIDKHIRDYMDTLTDSEIAAATGVIEPIEGRFWLGLKNRIYVLSYFPGGKISAWSFYEVDFTIKNLVRANGRIYARGTSSGTDYLYLYGGDDNSTYPDANEDIITIELPFFGASNPAGFKELTGFDIIATNNWTVEYLLDPNDDSKKETQGTSVGTTVGEPQFGAQERGVLFAVNLTCSDAGAATLSALAMHYNRISEAG